MTNSNALLSISLNNLIIKLLENWNNRRKKVPSTTKNKYYSTFSSNIWLESSSIFPASPRLVTVFCFGFGRTGCTIFGGATSFNKHTLKKCKKSNTFAFILSNYKAIQKLKRFIQSRNQQKKTNILDLGIGLTFAAVAGAAGFLAIIEAF